MSSTDVTLEPMSTSARGPADGTDLFEPGKTLLDRYRVIRLLAKGGVGEVYEAEDLETHGHVALKTVQREVLHSTKAPLRFQREYEFSQRIAHPNVLRIDSFFLAPAQNAEGKEAMAPCMVMELLSGETLGDRLERNETIPQDLALHIVCQSASALAAAHQADIVHRDLKPDNLFLADDAEPVRVVLMDFGVARQASPQEESLTASNVLLGTPSYMAPELLELEEAMPASDLYTFGLVMFEMLTGRPPFVADTPIQMVFKRLQEEPPVPSDLLPGLDPRWDETILRCLQRDPEDRYGDALEIIRSLDGENSTYLADERKRSWNRRTTAIVWSAVGLALAIALFFLVR